MIPGTSFKRVLRLCYDPIFAVTETGSLVIISKSKREKIYNLQKIATRTEVLSTRPAKMENIATAEIHFAKCDIGNVPVNRIQI